MVDDVINLALAFDEGYVTPFYVLLTSLFANNKKSSIAIHIIATGISEANKNAVEAFVAASGASSAFYDVSGKGIEQFVLPDHEENYLSVAIYYRLFFPFLVSKKIKKLLYIDVDTLVVGDLGEMFHLDTQGCAAAAVTDTDMPVRVDLGIGSAADYFNSGVLLIDIAQWKRQRITERALEIIANEPQKIKRYPDQDALNMVLKDNWYKLPSCYNLMRLYVPNEVPKRRFEEFLKDQKIIHYNGKKPWFSDCEHRLRHVYQQYARLSPRPEAIRITKVKLPKEKRDKLFRSRMVEFYFDHPALMAMWRKFKSIMD